MDNNVRIPTQEMTIGETGTLFLRRADQWIMQICPYQENNCSHNCPLFSEPIPMQNGMDLLLLCKKQLVGPLRDLRLPDTPAGPTPAADPVPDLAKMPNK
jgi:hypothetical protein